MLCNFSRPQHGRRAFTLVELLIVIGMIALILAILLPTVSRARASARIVTCTANLRQIDNAIRAWTLKYNDARLPGQTWPTSVHVMIGDPTTTERILACPDAPPFYTVSTTVVPEGTDLPATLADIGKMNGGHPATWVQINPNKWTATQLYHKSATNQSIQYEFTRVTGNSWLAMPTYIFPNKFKGVGPPHALGSQYDNKTYTNVQVGQTYLITGPPITPVTTYTNYDASSYGINNQLANVKSYTPGRVLIMDYNKTTIDVDTDATAVFLKGRHYNKQHNVLCTDGSIRLMNVKELAFANKSTLYAAQ